MINSVNRLPGPIRETMSFRSRSLMQSHLNRLSGPQRHRRLNLYWSLGDEVQAKSLGHHRQHERRLEHRECVADADARAAAERKVRVLWQPAGEPFRPAVGFESQGVRKPAWIAMNNPLTHQDVRISRNEVLANHHIFERSAADDISRRIKPHRFA